MSWEASLRLDLGVEAGRTVARFRHDGPLRLLQTLYPEGDTVAHHVLVHPPGGLVGGDRLAIDIDVGPGAHGLLTTPGAGRWYRSDGAPARQQVRLSLAAGARYEWLPLEAICHSGCIAENDLALTLAPGAEAIAWDVLALGLPASGQPFVAGSVLQRFALGDGWLDRGRIAAADTLLMDGPLGLAGHRCLGTLVFAAGQALPRGRREAALEAARAVIEAHGLAPTAGATAPCDEAVVLRVLAPVVEPAMALLRQVRAAWRTALWELPPTAPRTWAL